MKLTVSFYKGNEEKVVGPYLYEAGSQKRHIRKALLCYTIVVKIHIVVFFYISVNRIWIMSYNLNFNISSICDSSAVATSISYHGNVSSYLSCGAMCVNNLECITFLFFLANSTCFLKNDAVAEIQTCGDDDIRYGEMVS